MPDDDGAHAFSTCKVCPPPFTIPPYYTYWFSFPLVAYEGRVHYRDQRDLTDKEYTVYIDLFYCKVRSPFRIVFILALF